MTDIRDDARAGFEAVFGRGADGLWSAPGQITVLGDHTGHEGVALSFAIDRRTVVALGVRDDQRIRVASTLTGELAEIGLDQLAAENLSGWSAYPLGVAWALSAFGADLSAVPGVDLFIDSDVPVGIGLASSAALQSAVALALTDVWRLGLDRQTLARVGQRAESATLGHSADITDHWGSLHGLSDHAVLLNRRTLDSELVPLRLAEADLAFLVIDTDVTHPSAKPLHRDRHEAAENRRVLDTVTLLRQQGAASIGDMLDASHRSLRDDLALSTAELDLAVETAVGAGALGARMISGNAVIALVRMADLSRVQVAVDNAFGEHAFGQPDTTVVTASDGAARN